MILRCDANTIYAVGKRRPLAVVDQARAYAVLLERERPAVAQAMLAGLIYKRAGGSAWSGRRD